METKIKPKSVDEYRRMLQKQRKLVSRVQHFKYAVIENDRVKIVEI